MERLKKSNFSTILLIALVIIIGGNFGYSSNTVSKEKSQDKTLIVIENAVELKTNMRKLWEDHIIWTRNVILSLVDELPGIEQAETRLLQNQVDIGNAFKPYYGDEAGKKLTELLYPHITIFPEVVKAIRSGNNATIDEANKRWYINADKISEFLNKINPNWELANMKLMMHTHLKLTTEEALLRHKKDYDADIIAYDEIHDEILKMADMLSDGIIKQFPEKFKTVPLQKVSK